MSIEVVNISLLRRHNLVILLIYLCDARRACSIRILASAVKPSSGCNNNDDNNYRQILIMILRMTIE